MSIYVKLPSNGGGKEFNPTNTNALYKVRLLERLRLKHEDWEVALASISLPTVDAVKRNILKKFPKTTKVAFKSGMFHYREKKQPFNPTTNPHRVAVVRGVVTMADLVDGTVPVTNGYSFVQNLVIQLHNQLNLARQRKIDELKAVGTSVYYPEWDHSTNIRDQYEQTIQFGADEIIINGNY